MNPLVAIVAVQCYVVTPRWLVPAPAGAAGAGGGAGARDSSDLNLVVGFQVGDHEDHDNVEFGGVRVPIAPAQPVARVGGPTRGRQSVQIPRFTAAGPAFGTALATTERRPV